MIGVTNANSFTGAHLVEKLVLSGYEVRALVDFDYAQQYGALQYLSENILKQLDLHVGRIGTLTVVEKFVKDVDTVFYFSLGDSMSETDNTVSELVNLNTIGTFNLLQSIKKHAVNRLILISTSDVYGNVTTTEKIEENSPLNPISIPVASHICTENLVQGAATEYDFNFSIVRLFNVYGPCQSPSAVIPTIILQALTGEDVFLGQMSAVRDFVFISDVVDGLLKCHENSDSIGEIINFSSGIGLQIGVLAEKIRSIMALESEIIFDANRIMLKPSNISKLVGSTQKAKELLGWQASTSTDNGLEKTIKWFSEKS